MEASQEILKYFAKYIESELGIVYVEANFFQLEHRLKNIATQFGFNTLEELHAKAKLGITGSMKNLLLDLATNNETSFFRDAAIFRALSGFIVPEILARGYKSSLDIWCCASSAGQEVYSTMMELQQFKKTNSLPPISFLASDVSDTILVKAKSGIYTQLEVQRGLPAKLMVEYFTKDESDNWHIKDNIKNCITFKKINLLDSWGHIGPFDIIFCRNVLIYQNVENKIKIISELAKKLNPKGYLILGAAESLFGLSNEFEQLTSDGAIFFRKLE